MLDIADTGALLAHPKCGASWEGFVMEQLIRELAPDEVYFWAIQAGLRPLPAQVSEVTFGCRYFTAAAFRVFFADSAPLLPTSSS